MVENLQFNGQVVVITGAGGGLGRAHALDLASRGAKVVVNDLGGNPDGTGGSQSMADKVVEEIRQAGSEAVANYDSVATSEGGEAVIQTALDTWGKVDGVVANAGILRDRSFANMSLGELEGVLDVHLRGTFFTLQPAFRHMKATGNGGRLVVTSSGSGLFGNFGQSNYAAAKLGVVGMMRVISMEGVKYNITCNALAPAAATRLTSGEDFEGERSPVRVTPIVTALLHPTNRITGETFYAGYGWYARAYVALTEGWYSGQKFASAEDIVSHWDQIRSRENSHEPQDAFAAVKIFEEIKGRIEK